MFGLIRGRTERLMREPILTEEEERRLLGESPAIEEEATREALEEQSQRDEADTKTPKS